MSPDGWVRYYYERRDSAGAAAFNLVESEGAILAHACGKCGGRRPRKTRTLEWVCARKRCQTEGQPTPWPFQPAYVLRGVVQSSLDTEHGLTKMARYLDVARELARFLDEQGTVGRIYVAAALGHGRQAIAELGPRAWPGDAFPWSEWHVREAIREGRTAWIEKLKRVRLA
jgi:hypothetical protein